MVVILQLDYMMLVREHHLLKKINQEYYKMNEKIFDSLPYFVGEQTWNYADFQTKFGLFRVQGNKKGIFTRARQPKMIAHHLRNRWLNIPNFNYKK